MPNWCYTGITFYSRNTEQLRSMHNKFVEINNAPSTVKENKFGSGYMGDYVNTLLPEYGNTKIDCRGAVTYIDGVQAGRDGGMAFFKIETETAWDAKIGMWQKIISTHYPEVEIAYIGEEFACG